jgi:toxin CptA
MEAAMDTFKYSGEAPPNDPAWRVVIAPGPSRRVRSWVVGVFAAALAALLLAPLAPLAKAAAAPALAVAAFRALRRHGWQEGPGGMRALAVDLASRLEVEHADGSRAQGRVLDGSFVAPWLVIVRWRPVGARLSRTILLAPDAVDAHEFRRLRILLRWR